MERAARIRTIHDQPPGTSMDGLTGGQAVGGGSIQTEREIASGEEARTRSGTARGEEESRISYDNRRYSNSNTNGSQNNNNGDGNQTNVAS
ncbi:hypothetical protein WG66_009791, partial [Moniliophthora roreri]